MKKFRKSRIGRAGREMLHAAVYVFFIEAYCFVRILPDVARPYFAWLLALAVYSFPFNSRRRVLKNLDIAYGSKMTEGRKRDVTIRFFRHVILNFCETVALSRMSAQRLKNLVEVREEEKLRGVLQSGRGVIAISAHLGNFPLMQTRLARAGFPLRNIAKDSNNMYVLRFIQRFRERVGMPFISKENVRNAVRDSGRWLRHGGIVSFYVDQHAGRGARALFFGHPVRVPEGAAVFARKYGCPVVGIFSWRNDDGRHTVVVEGPYHLRKTGNAPADIQENTEYFIHRVQVHVAAHPEQWFTWLTRRFR